MLVFEMFEDLIFELKNQLNYSFNYGIKYNVSLQLFSVFIFLSALYFNHNLLGKLTSLFLSSLLFCSN